MNAKCHKSHVLAISKLQVAHPTASDIIWRKSHVSSLADEPEGKNDEVFRQAMMIADFCGKLRELFRKAVALAKVRGIVYGIYTFRHAAHLVASQISYS